MMLRHLSLGLIASAVTVTQLPVHAEIIPKTSDTKDHIKPGSNRDKQSTSLASLKARFQGSTQGAGTPNQAGVGVFIPLSQGDRYLFYSDIQANVDLSDFRDYSSINTTLVKGATISTSTRLGIRWLNEDKTLMYGFNAGYDTRPMATGETTDGVNLFDTETSVFFQQIGLEGELASKDFGLKAYSLLPVGKTEQWLNWYAAGGALNTYGIDLKIRAINDLSASIGYYYQHGDLGAANGSGVKAKLTYELAEGLEVSLQGTYDNAFETRISGNIVYSFGGKTVKNTSISDNILIAIDSIPTHRNIRVHDCHWWDLSCDVHKVISGVESGVKAGIRWGEGNIIEPSIRGAEKLGLTANEAHRLMHKLEEKLGQKIAKKAFKKIVKKVLKWSEDSENVAKEDTRALREFSSKVSNGYDTDGLEGVAEVMAENPELTAEALGEAAEVGAE